MYEDIRISYKLRTGYDQYENKERIKSIKEWFGSLLTGKKKEEKGKYRTGMYIVVNVADSRFASERFGSDTSENWFYMSTYNLAVVRKFEETKNPRVLSRLIDSIWNCDEICPEEFSDKIKLVLGAWEVDGDNYSVKVFCFFTPVVYEVNDTAKPREYWYGKGKPDTREDPIYTITVKKEDFTKKESILNQKISIALKQASEFYFNQLVRPYDEKATSTNNNLEDEDASKTKETKKAGEVVE